ncbi:MAG: hypothetical protein M1309_05955 [Actinobacteria bacterium]|nr:hypothetical protein [Actinomycetota bacterium]
MGLLALIAVGLIGGSLAGLIMRGHGLGIIEEPLCHVASIKIFQPV